MFIAYTCYMQTAEHLCRICISKKKCKQEHTLSPWKHVFVHNIIYIIMKYKYY